MTALTVIRCDGCGTWAEPDPARPNAQTLRGEAGERGWHRQPGSTDVCPQCWEKRVRFRLAWKTYVAPNGREGKFRSPELFILPTGWGNGRARS